MKVDIELYKIFYNVAKFGNITKASQALFISQPAVTMSIKKLELELGTDLFIRTRKGVTLTRTGEVLYEYISRAMQNIQNGENQIANLKKLESGSIKIGIGRTLAKYFLIGHLKQFHKLYPNIVIDIDTSMSESALQKLEDRDLDMAVIIGEPSEFKNLNIEYMEDMEYIVVGNYEYYSKIGSEIKVSEINSYPLILQSKKSSSRLFLDKVMAENNVKLNSSMELTSYSLVIELVKIGMGIGFVSKSYVKKELENNELYEINLIPKIKEQKIMVLTKGKKVQNISAQKLIDIIKGGK